MPLREAVDAAWTLASNCVGEGEGVGGKGFLGEKGLVQVTVFGVEGTG